MKRKIQLILLFTCFATVHCVAQTTFEVPKNVQLKTREDYAKYEPDIINAANWLEETDLDKELDKRKEVGKFFMEWMLGSPNVSVEMNNQVVDLFEDNAKLMTIYYAGAARFVLQNKTSATKFSTVKAGLSAVIKVYKKQVGINKNKILKKLVTSNDNNKLDEFISNEMKVAQN